MADTVGNIYRAIAKIRFDYRQPSRVRVAPDVWDRLERLATYKTNYSRPNTFADVPIEVDEKLPAGGIEVDRVSPREGTQNG